MKKVRNNDGIAGWKIDHPLERKLSKLADKSLFWKKMYVKFYKVFDKQYYVNGLKFIEKNINTFVGVVSKQQKQEYIVDMVYSLHRFGCMFDEYFFFDFRKLNTQGREAFITDKIRWSYYERMNLDENKELFNNKRKAYELFKEYYKRELIEISCDDDFDSFIDFVKRHDRFIIKPIAGSGGKGISIVSITEYDDINHAFSEIRKIGPVVIEELIIQARQMNQLHPKSLQTIRVPTLVVGDNVEVFHPVLRIGIGDSVVDNASSGGIICPVDVATGICYKEGVDERGNRYIHHPDTNAVLPGFQIPQWGEAIKLAKKLAHIVKGNHYVGWDLALTDDGWVMVEGNPRGQFIMQVATQQGVKEELEVFISKM